MASQAATSATTQYTEAVKPDALSWAAITGALKLTSVRIIVAVAIIAGILIAYILPKIWAWAQETFGSSDTTTTDTSSTPSTMKGRSRYMPLPGVPDSQAVTEKAKANMRARAPQGRSSFTELRDPQSLLARAL